VAYLNQPGPNRVLLKEKKQPMPRYMVERTFPDGLRIPIDGDGAKVCEGVVERNAESGVTLVHSLSEDKTKTFCVYDGTDPESIRRAGSRNGLPTDSITRVSVLDPYFYQ
jgi:hypothetical protein